MPAHLTLVHALPPSVEGEVRRLLGALAAERAPLQLEVRGWRRDAGHVALALASPALAALHAELQMRLAGLLSAQDTGGRRFHVTVMDKVSAGEARALVARLALPPAPVRVVALRLWRYLDGPWAPLMRAPLRAPGRCSRSPA